MTTWNKIKATLSVLLVGGLLAVLLDEGRVVDQDVDLGPVLLQGVGEPPNLVQNGEVAGVGAHNSGARGTALGRDVLQATSVPAHQPQVRATRGEPKGGGGSDAGARAGHDARLPCHIPHA